MRKKIRVNPSFYAVPCLEEGYSERCHINVNKSMQLIVAIVPPGFPSYLDHYDGEKGV